jgi:hypothetical protein
MGPSLRGIYARERTTSFLVDKLAGRSYLPMDYSLRQHAKCSRQTARHERLEEIIKRPDFELKRQDVGKHRAPRQAIVVHITRA